jgi:hypothetical protein
MTRLVEHLEAVRDNALARADRLLEEAGDEPNIGTLSMVELYLSDADRAGRLLTFLQERSLQNG